MKERSEKGVDEEEKRATYIPTDPRMPNGMRPGHKNTTLYMTLQSLELFIIALRHQRLNLPLPRAQFSSRADPPFQTPWITLKAVPRSQENLILSKRALGNAVPANFREVGLRTACLARDWRAETAKVEQDGGRVEVAAIFRRVELVVPVGLGTCIIAF